VIFYNFGVITLEDVVNGEKNEIVFYPERKFRGELKRVIDYFLCKSCNAKIKRAKSGDG
jgi:hypothetical protein